MEYFKLIWDDEMTKNLVEETNNYSIQVSRKCINANVKEMKQFLGLHMLTSIIRLPGYGMCEANKFRFDEIASVMSLKRYQALRRYLHANENVKKMNAPGEISK